MAEQFLTVEQVALRLHVHPITVRRQLRRGLLRGIKRGNLWRIPESALQEKPTTEVTPLVRALKLIRERDARSGPVTIRRDGGSAADLRAIREAQNP